MLHLYLATLDELIARDDFIRYPNDYFEGVWEPEWRWKRVLFKRGPGRESGPGGPPRVYPGCWLTSPAGRGTR